MPRSREEILSATTSNRGSPENRLTELFASTLESCPQFASALLSRVGLPPGDRVEVFTQQQVAPGSRVDMVVRALAANGAPVAQLWSEHKLDAGFGVRQRERYWEELEKVVEAKRLIVIARQAGGDLEDEGWHGITWHDIADLASGLGYSWAEADWRAKALEPAAPASWRILHEFLWYLEEEGVSVSSPLRADHIRAYEIVEETADLLGTLLERAGEAADGLAPDGDLGGDAVVVWQAFAPHEGSWTGQLPEEEVNAELLASNVDYWSAERLREPVFGAGYAMAREWHGRLADRSEWLAQLAEHGFSFAIWADWLRIYRTLPMSDLLKQEATLTHQARRLGEWTAEAIGLLGTLDPGIGSAAAPVEKDDRAPRERDGA